MPVKFSQDQSIRFLSYREPKKFHVQTRMRAHLHTHTDIFCKQHF